MARNPLCYLDAPDLTRLDLASVLVREVLDTPYPHPLRHFLEAHMSEHYASHTGLRVDFQIQRMSEANARYRDGLRHPLGIYPYLHEPPETEG